MSKETIFQIGERVRCIRAGDRHLVSGKVYTVVRTDVDSGLGRNMLWVEGEPEGYFMSRFERVDLNTKPQLIKWLEFAREHIQSRSADNEIKELIAKLRKDEPIW